MARFKLHTITPPDKEILKRMGRMPSSVDDAFQSEMERAGKSKEAIQRAYGVHRDFDFLYNIMTKAGQRKYFCTKICDKPSRRIWGGDNSAKNQFYATRIYNEFIDNELDTLIAYAQSIPDTFYFRSDVKVVGCSFQHKAIALGGMPPTEWYKQNRRRDQTQSKRAISKTPLQTCANRNPPKCHRLIAYG